MGANIFDKEVSWPPTASMYINILQAFEVKRSWLSCGNCLTGGGHEHRPQLRRRRSGESPFSAAGDREGPRVGRTDLQVRYGRVASRDGESSSGVGGVSNVDALEVGGAGGLGVASGSA